MHVSSASAAALPASRLPLVFSEAPCSSCDLSAELPWAEAITLTARPDASLLVNALGLCRHKDGCTAWMWCAEESGCTDDRGLEVPFKGCQLKNEPMQAWGLPSASLAESMKVANSYSGYIKRENPLTFCRRSAPVSLHLTDMSNISHAMSTSMQAVPEDGLCMQACCMVCCSNKGNLGDAAPSASMICAAPGMMLMCCALSADRKKNQKTFVRLHSAPLPTVMIAMYVPPTSCAADKGDYFTRLSIMNKQDYVRWFSGELMIGTKTFDPSLRPTGHHEVRSLRYCILVNYW